jgi:hypothetical protein
LRLGLGWNLGGRAAESQVVFEHWQIARRAIGQAQETYDQAVNEYREFVQGVPAPLRAKATEKGMVAMTICHS